MGRGAAGSGSAGAAWLVFCRSHPQEMERACFGRQRLALSVMARADVSGMDSRGFLGQQASGKPGPAARDDPADMKILMLHNRYLLPGGEDQATLADAALLRDQGHDVDLLVEDN